MPLLFVLFFLSGATGLVYELIWTRELTFVFGGTTYAITTVLVAFMGGLGLGSFVAGRVAHRFSEPGRVYGLLELLIGAYALAIPFLLGLANPLYRAVYQSVADEPGLLTALRFVIGATILVVPTFCMGATLPIAVRYVTMSGAAVGGSVARLYGINTLGAVIGVLATGFVLIPTFGLSLTTHIAAAANLLIGLLAVLILSGRGAAHAAHDIAPVSAPAAPPPRTHSEDAVNTALAAFAVSGFAAMVYQIMWTRTLIMAIGSSTYSFTCILAAFILGLALGSLAIARRVDRWRNPLLVVGFLQIGIAVSSMLVVPLLGRAPLAAGMIVEWFANSFATLLVAEFALVISLLLVPTVLMGAVFPLVTRVASAGCGDAAAATGRAYLLNTLGTILGALLAGFVLIRSAFLGVQLSISFASMLLAIVGVFVIHIAQREGGAVLRGKLAIWAWGGLIAVPTLGLLFGPWDDNLLASAPFLGGDRAVFIPSTHELLTYEEGVDLTVAVHRSLLHPDLVSLSVNGKTDASTNPADMPTQLLLGHLGALLRPHGTDACVIGLGGGFTLAAVARHPQFERIDCVEISDEVITAASEFFSEFNYNVIPTERSGRGQDQRVHMVHADGRNHLLLTDRRYDLIVSEPSNPWIAGVASLFTREFYELCEQRLEPGGVLTVWVQAYSISVDDFRMIVRTLTGVFDFVTVWDTTGGDSILVASRKPFAVPADDVIADYMHPPVRADLHRIGANHLGQVLGAFIASDAALRRFAGDAPVHTDDNALLEFSTPRDLLKAGTLDLELALHDIQHPLGPEIVVFDPQNQQHAEISARIERAAQARVLRDRAEHALLAGDDLAALKTYVEAYRLDPGNVAITLRYNRLLTDLRTNRPQRFEDAQYIPALRELQTYRGPLLAPLRGGTLEQVKEFNFARGVSAFDGHQFAKAVQHLEAAVAIDAQDAKCAHMLALSYSRCDRVADAIATIEPELQRDPTNGSANYLRAQFAAHEGDVQTAVGCLEIVLDRGVFSAEQLAEDPLFESLHPDERFQALLRVRGASTRPAP